MVTGSATGETDVKEGKSNKRCDVDLCTIYKLYAHTSTQRTQVFGGMENVFT